MKGASEDSADYVNYPDRENCLLRCLERLYLEKHECQHPKIKYRINIQQKTTLALVHTPFADGLLKYLGMWRTAITNITGTISPTNQNVGFGTIFFGNCDVNYLFT